ncbi:MAG: twitching motility protein PilT [Lachnospiraceae bacterium]|nr:twitching motility protein PilT [Lachnospiraceae bacterium]
MVRLIVGHKGKGKTTEILQIANDHIKEASGSVVYLDKSNKHMYELNNKIRLIDVSRYPIENNEQFIGFICGILSQDHDIQEMYLDGFLKCAKLKEDNITDTILKLNAVSTQFDIDFLISVSVPQEDLDDRIKDLVVLSL